MQTIYFIYEQDNQASKQSIVIKLATTRKKQALDFFETFKEEYTTTSGFNLVVSYYDGDLESANSESNLLNELIVIEQTEN